VSGGGALSGNASRSRRANGHRQLGLKERHSEMPLAPPAFVQVIARVRPPADPSTTCGLIVNGAQICLERAAGSDAASMGVGAPEDARSWEAFVFDCCFDGSRPRSVPHGSSIGSVPPGQSSIGQLEEDLEADSSQEEFFKDCGMRFCDDGLNGFDSCLIAYGQRGAGKSHTVIGTRAAPGLVPRVAEQLLSQQVPDLTVCLSVLEITPGEELRDLLCASSPGGSTANSGPASLTTPQAPSTTSHARTRSWGGPSDGGTSTAPESAGRTTVPISLVEHPQLGVYVAGLSEVVCTTANGVKELLRHSVRERAIAVTSLGGSIQTNTLYILRLQRGSGSPTWAANRGLCEDSGIPAPVGARILLADLACSECSPLPYGSPGPKPGRPIPCSVNEGLFNLHLVVRSLSEGGGQGAAGFPQGKTPFGASKLTQLLKGPLLGNARATLLAAVSPSRVDLEESRRTLQFASCVGRIPTSEPQRERPIAEIVAQLKEQVRNLRQQLAATSSDALPADLALTADLASWEWVLERQSQAPFRRNATEFEEWNAREVEAVHRRRGLFTGSSTSGALMVDGGPFLSNLSADAQLHGALIFSLRRPPSGTVTVGSHRECGIILCGVGIPPRLCELSVAAGDEVTLRLLPPFARQQPCRCTLNGGVVRRGSDARIEHGDRLIFGWAHAFQLCAPDRAQRLGQPVALPAFTEDDALRELSPDDSETYSELSLYIEDIREKMNESIAVEFLELLKVACHLVDEANEIMRDMRPDLELKFDVDFVWDIFRRAQDVLLIRVIQLSPAGENYGESTVQSYWTYAKFGERLGAMRACYNSFVLFGKCGSFGPAVNNPFEDPWMEPSLLDLRHRLHVEKALIQTSSEGAVRDLGSTTSTGPEVSSTAPATEISTPTATPARTGRTQGRAAPQRGRASPGTTHHGRSSPTSTFSARPTGARGTAVGADGAGGPVAATFEGDKLDTAKSDNTAAARSLSPASGGRSETEVERMKREAQKQLAELRRVKNDLQAADRERRLHEELIESLRAQLTDKTELIGTLRALLQDRPQGSRPEEMQKSGRPERPSSLERIRNIPKLRLDEMHRAQEQGRLDDMHKGGRPSSLERTRPTTPGTATADNASVADSTTGSSSHAACVNFPAVQGTNAFHGCHQRHPSEETLRGGMKPEDKDAFSSQEAMTHGHAAQDASQTSTSSMPLVPPRALPMKVVSAGGRQLKGGSLDSKSPPFMTWTGEVAFPPGSSEVMGSASMQGSGSYVPLVGGHPPSSPMGSPLQVATVETTGDLIQRPSLETALWAQIGHQQPVATPSVKSNAGSFTAAPFALTGQADRMQISAPATAPHLPMSAVVSAQHVRTGSASPAPYRSGGLSVQVMQGGSAVRFASPVPTGHAVTPQTRNISPTNSRLPSPLAARMDWSFSQSAHGPGRGR